jgi:hypothetical protein
MLFNNKEDTNFWGGNEIIAYKMMRRSRPLKNMQHLLCVM